MDCFVKYESKKKMGDKIIEGIELLFIRKNIPVTKKKYANESTRPISSQAPAALNEAIKNDTQINE